MDYCSSITDKLSAFIDDYLNQEERAELKTHLENCPECKEKYEQLSQLTNSVKELPKLTTCSDFEEKLWQRINSEKKKNVIDFTKQKRKNNFFKMLNNGMVYIAGIAAAAIGFLVIDQTGVIEFNENEITPKIQINKMVAENNEKIDAAKENKDTLKVLRQHNNPEEMIHRVSDETE